MDMENMAWVGFFADLISPNQMSNKKLYVLFTIEGYDEQRKHRFYLFPYLLTSSLKKSI